MIGYLDITGLDLALLINFKNARLEWKRVLRPQQGEECGKPKPSTLSVISVQSVVLFL